MHLLIFGASGGTGRHLVGQALVEGHTVTAFVRDPARLPVFHSELKHVRGDVLDAGAVEGVVAGHDAVLVALGAPSPVRRYPALTDGLRHIVGAMERARVPRLVYLSFIGVRESRHYGGFIIEHLASRLLQHSIADHEANETLIRGSALDWTLVHPPKLTNGPRAGAYRHGETIRARSVFPTISRADLAEFMLGLLLDRTYLKKAVSVMP